jgi:histidinol dehydrogenase
VLTRSGTLATLSGAGELSASIGALLEDVRQRGDTALIEALATFDGVTVEAAQLSARGIAGMAARTRSSA